MNNKLAIGLVTLTVLLFSGGVYLNSRVASSEEVQSESVNSDTGGKATTSETSHDWGEIKLNGGDVEKSFEIKNEGTGELMLTNVVTSCMCTTARLSLGKESSPEFGMHSKSPYVMKVPPGETANLTVIFDPAFHGPSGVGPINRQIQIETNDPENSKLNFTLTAMVRR